MNEEERQKLNKLYAELKEKQLFLGDDVENYKTGYKNGLVNGQVELLEKILCIDNRSCLNEQQY